MHPIDCDTRQRIVDRLHNEPAVPVLVRAGEIDWHEIRHTTWHHVDTRREILVDERLLVGRTWRCGHYLTDEGRVLLAAHLPQEPPTRRPVS